MIKKLSFLAVIVMMMLIIAAPAMAFDWYTFKVSASSSAFVSSTSFGNSGSGATAGNTSLASVKFSSDPAVATLALTSGFTGGYGWNIASMGGSAGGTGTLNGVGFHW